MNLSLPKAKSLITEVVEKIQTTRNYGLWCDPDKFDEERIYHLKQTKNKGKVTASKHGRWVHQINKDKKRKSSVPNGNNSRFDDRSLMG